jgi:hypothetical protein
MLNNANNPGNDPFASFAKPIATPAASVGSDPFASFAKPIKKKEDTASSGEASSTDGGFKVGFHSGMGVDLTKKAYSGLYKSDDDEESSGGFRAISTALKTSIPNMAASLLGFIGNVTENVVSSAKEIKDFYTGKSSYSPGSFFKNIEEQSKLAEQATKGKGVIESGAAIINLEQKAQNRPTSKESIAAPIYELASEMQRAGDVLFDVSQKQWGIAPENQNKSILTLATEGNVGDAFKIAGLNVARSMPQSMLLAATGGSTGVFTGAAISAGGAEVTRAYQQDGDVDVEDTYRAIGYGLVEGMSEMMFQGDLNALRSLGRKAIGLTDDAVKSSIKKLVADEGKDAAKQKIVRSFLDGGIQTAFKGGLEEGVEEVVAAIGSFGVDRILDGKASPEQWNKLMHDVVDGFVIGNLSGFGMSGALAKASQVKLTETEKRSIARYKEIANDDTQFEDVREIAREKIKSIKKYSIDKAYENYGLFSSIEDKAQRADALDRANVIQSLEEKKQNVKDIDIQEDLDNQIKYHKDILDNIFEQNYSNILSRTQQGQEAMGKLAKANAEEFINSNNLFQEYETAHQEVINKIDNQLEVESTSLNQAANTLYSLQTQVEQNEELSNTEKDIVLNKIDQQLNKIEGYKFATKNGQLVSPVENADAFKSESKKRAERAKRLQNQRFEGEVIEVTNPEGKKSKMVASVSANGEVKLSPKRRYRSVSEEQAIEDNTVAVGDVTIESTEKDDSGNFVSAVLNDTKTGNKLKVTNGELISFLSNKEAKQQAMESANRQYSVDSNIMQAQNKILGKLTPGAKQRLANSYQALQSINPDAQIILYDNASDMANGLISRGYSKTKANKAAKTSTGLHHAGVIHIDVSRMSDSTAAHEIFHEAVVKMAKDNPAEFQAMKEKIIKVLSDNNIETLNKFLESYSNESQDVQNEEFLAELAGLMTTKDIQLDRPLMQKIAIAIRDFVASIADRLDSKVLSDYANSLFTEEASVEEVANFFEGLSKSLREGGVANLDYVTSRQEAPATTEDLEAQDPYSEGLSVEVEPDSFKASKPILKSQKIGKYEFPEGAVFESINLPSKSLKDVIAEYDGRVIIITSDATGYGVDSLGEPILGGFGFSTIKKNIEDGIGFASVNEGAVKSTMSRAYNIHGEGKAAVLIMIQPPFTTIGNSYGVKYFARGLKEVATATPEQLDSIKQAMKDYVLNNKAVADELAREDSKTGKRNTEKALFALIDSIDSNIDINQFTQEFIKDTTFNSRTAILNGFMIDSLDIRTNAKTDPVKLALKNVGYSKTGFLNEYGDSSFLTEDLISNNIGNFVVGGFEVDIKSEEQRNSEISELQNKGIEHPLFNGKLGGTNHFVLDGLYDVNENFSEYATAESAIDMAESERDDMVRELYPNDNDYKPKSRNKPLEERKYTDLLAEKKIAFKKDVLMPKGLVKFNKANVAASVARSMGFNLDESKRDDLKQAEFKQRQKDTLRQQVTLPSIMQNKRDELEALRKANLTTVWNGIVKALFERNINVKKAFEQADFEYALYAMYNKAGASNFGTLKFAERYKEIYEGVSKSNRKLLDDIIFLRRVIAIDNNRANLRKQLTDRIDFLKGILKTATSANDIKSIKKQIADLQKDLRDKPTVLHTSHTDYATKKDVPTNEVSAKKTLADMERLLGKEAYDALYSRSDKYFKAFSDILKYKFDNGIIDEATYNMYKDYNYSPRQFMMFMYGIQNNELSGITLNSFNSRGSLVTKKDINNITGGSEELLELDTEKLLHAAMIAAEVKVATNKATKVLHDEMVTANYDWIKEANYDRYSDGTIKMNPDGSPKILAADNAGKNNAFRNMYYKVDGKSYAFQMRDNLAKEFYDEQLFDKSNIYYKIISNSTGAAIVRAIATGMNMAFPISNIPVDIISQVHLNDIYAGGVAGQYQQAVTGTLNLAEELLKAEFKLGDNTDINNLILEYGQAGGLMLTQTMEANIAGKVGEALGLLGNISELASKLNAYKTMRDTMLEEYNKKNGRDAEGVDLEKIKAKAAFKARAAMDYHRGGLATKWLDGFIPYLNVLTQANKITAEYIINNPKEFTKKIGAVGGALAAITIYNLMVAGDDYDNDDVQNDLLKNIVIFHPFKNEDGTRAYTKIAVPNTVKGFLNIFQNQAEGIYYRSIDGKEKELEAWKADRLQKSLSVLLPSTSSFFPPAYKAIKEYSNNIDTWRNRPIYNGPKVEDWEEGADNKKVTEFMKVLGAATATTTNIRGTEYKTGGISPIRGQKALEDILPVSNPLVQMAYSLMDKSINTFSIGNLKPEQRSKYETGNLTDIPMAFLGAIKNRAVDVSDPKIVYKNGLKETFDVIQKAENRRYQIVKTQISEAVKAGKNFDAVGTIVNNNGEEFLSGAAKYYTFLKTKNTINYPQFENEYAQIMFEKSPVSQGKMIYQLNQDLLAPNKSPEAVKLLKDLIVLKMWDKAVIPYYLEAYNNEQKSIKK